MKISKVEIQAFRAYDKVEDGTFDFQRKEDGEYADFISLYAPNGFGKTSFYDAVEYGYTKNIDRFLKNTKINQDSAKSEKNLNKGNTQYILRNKYSDLNLSTFVKIQLLNGQEPIIRNIPAVTRRGSSDFKFDEKETENKYFREVILSQDWISGFLKEDKPEERYKTFIEYFGDKELDKYYNTIQSLISQNEKEIQKINKRLVGIQLQLQFEGDLEILSKVNEKISLLNENIKLFTLIDSQTSEKDILQLTNSISERLNEIDFDLESHRQTISELDRIIIGDEYSISFRKFKEDFKDLTAQLEKQKSLGFLLTNFDNLKKKKSELSAIQTTNINLASSKENKVRVLGLIEKYDKAINSLEDKNDELSKLQVSKDHINEQLNNQKANLSKLEILISSNKDEIQVITQTNNNLLDIAQQISHSEELLTQLRDDLNIKKAEHEVKTNEILSLQSINDELNNSIISIEEADYPSEYDANFKKYSKYILKINELKKKLNEENQSLNSLLREFDQYELFKSELDEFVSKGLSIINENQTPNCPLCNQEYKSYNELADNVTSNKLLTYAFNALLKRKNEIDSSINSISDEMEKLTALLLNAIKKDVSENELNLSNLKTNLLEVQGTISNLTSKVDNEIRLLSNLRGLILNKSTEDYSEWSKNRMKELNNEIQKNQDDLMTTRNKIKKNEEEVNIIVSKIELLIKDIGILNEDHDIFDVKTFFAENYPNQEITFKFLQQDISRLVTRQEDNQVIFERLKEEIRLLENDLLNIEEDSLQEEYNDSNNRITTLSRGIENYKLEANKYSLEDLHNLEEEDLLNRINKLKKNNEEKISKLKNEEKELKLLSQLKDNVLPYLNFEKNKKIENDLKTTKSLKNRVTKSLKDEADKVSLHIETQIRSFFYEDLINDLYKRIDPHPDYKKVKFIPDFKDNKPKLNVCLYKENDDKSYIIPNLYFSQAQLNILSLCIFLAKALNAKDGKGKAIDCIFVDDPIQSMDSINILSTIDLLRSIVVNQQKQIILSTHDENFHNLLKKKIPSNLFKSKFMELETFGKVKG